MATPSSSRRPAGRASRASSSSTKAGPPRCARAYGHDVVQFLEESSLLGERADDAQRTAVQLLSRKGLEGETHATELVSRGRTTSSW